MKGQSRVPGQNFMSPHEMTPETLKVQNFVPKVGKSQWDFERYC